MGSCAIVGNNLLEHGGESLTVDLFALTDSHRAGCFIVVPASNDPFRIRNGGSVVEKYVDMILRREQGADVALQHKVRTVCALDSFNNLWVGGVDDLTHLAADSLLPIDTNGISQWSAFGWWTGTPNCCLGWS